MNLKTCPECGAPIEPPDMVDIGVGEIPCGPQGCERCGWVERQPIAEDEWFVDELPERRK